MTKRKRRSFTPEFKADAVRLVKAGDRGIAQEGTQGSEGSDFSVSLRPCGLRDPFEDRER
jgi:hypothetical protein